MKIDKLEITKLIGILYRELTSKDPDWDRISDLIGELYALAYI